MRKYNTIILRRCQSHNKFIDFHLDTSMRTLQLALNHQSEYVGGRLVYVNEEGIQIP